MAIFPRTLFSGLKKHDIESPIFVLGHQKSGTTVIASLIAKALGLSYSHDMFFRQGWTDTDDLLSGRLTVSDLVLRAPKEFRKGVIKDPDLSFVLPDIRKNFPNSKIVFVHRDPRNNLFSIYNRLGIDGSTTLEELHNSKTIKKSRLWRNVFNEYPSSIVGETPIELLAMRWKCLVQTFLVNRGVVSPIRYEDFNMDKVNSIKQIIESMGLTTVFSFEKFVDVQYQPQSDNSVSPETFFGRKSILRIEEICSYEMNQLGYQKHQL